MTNQSRIHIDHKDMDEFRYAIINCHPALIPILHDHLKEERESFYNCDAAQTGYLPNFIELEKFLDVFFSLSFESDLNPLHIACKYGWKDVIEHLAYLNHNNESLSSNFDLSFIEGILYPLKILCKYGHLDCLDIFPVDDDFLERCGGRHHPVYYAAKNHHFDIVMYYGREKNQTQYLVWEHVLELCDWTKEEEKVLKQHIKEWELSQRACFIG